MEWFETYDHLGSHYPYVVPGDPPVLATNVADALRRVPGPRRVLDPVAVLEVLSTNFVLGQRTLVRGVERAPWMARPDGQGGWERATVPLHGSLLLAPEEAAARLKALLREEAASYLEGCSDVGILLSGGMDSRIAAGVVRELQEEGRYAGRVHALTWGLPESRDVVYSRSIAQRFGWRWTHLPLGPDVLQENVFLCGEMGAEFAPIHLHGLARVREMDGLDAVLAGSYGDSVGRAEFSGRHVLRMRSVVPSVVDPFGLVRARVVRDHRAAIPLDAHADRALVPREREHQHREVEAQRHYMRRMLQACMSHVAERRPLYQLFTAPEVFGFMWSLDPRVRDDRVYAHLVGSLPGALHEVPWARTGRPFGVAEGPADTHSKIHHRYGAWLREDLFPLVRERVTGGWLQSVGVFNDAALERLLRRWRDDRLASRSRLDEAFSWLASLSVFIERHGVRSPPGATAGWRDGLRAQRGAAAAWLERRRRIQLHRRGVLA